MTLSEIRNEHRQTRLKTNRWHQLNDMAKARTSEISAKFGHQGSQGALYHRAEAAKYHMKSNSASLIDYFHRTKYKRLKEMHSRIAEALRGD